MSEETFGKWRQRLWPIHRFETKKLLPLLLMKFLISLNYAILTCMKDTMIVTAKGSGAEVIPVLKGWVVLPVAILATLAYSKLSNLLNRKTLFYLIMTLFLSVIFVYGFYLYPNMDVLSPHASADKLQAFLGGKGLHWVSVFRNWIPSLFFVTAELWGGFVIFLLFWGFTNTISAVGEAKRTYTLYIAAGDVASIVTGPIVWHFAKKYAHIDFSFTLQKLVLLVVAFGAIIMGLHFYITNYVLTDKRFALPKQLQEENKKKTKLSLFESIKHIAKSKYLFNIAIMVIAYGLTINLIEVSWKANLKMLHPDPIHYQAYMGTVTTIIGILATITVLLFGGGIIRYFGWLFSAQITPIVIGTTGFLFFALLLFRKFFPGVGTVYGFDLLTLVVTVGAIQNIATKVMKYSFFDPTKEMAYIPLDPESKTKGKAAIDVVGARLGKSGAAWIQVGLIDLLGATSILSISHILLPIIAVSIFAWINSTRYVNKEFDVRSKAVN